MILKGNIFTWKLNIMTTKGHVNIYNMSTMIYKKLTGSRYISKLVFCAE